MFAIVKCRMVESLFPPLSLAKKPTSCHSGLDCRGELRQFTGLCEQARVVEIIKVIKVKFK